MWQSVDEGEIRAAAARLREAEPGFDCLYEALKRGRTYATDVPRGVVEGKNRTSDGSEHHFAYVVPDSYDPSVPIAVRYMLHGGVSTSERRKGSYGPIENLRQVGEITVLPSAWREAPWWSATQIENLSGILQHLKRHYNVDEDLVHLSGVSDGAAGAYFLAMKDTTPWAGFLPLIGDLAVLRSAARGTQLYLENLLNKPFFVVNTTDDPLYPSDRVARQMELLRDAGVAVEFHAQAGFGHNTNWWAQKRDAMDRFSKEKRRIAHPERLRWVTDGASNGRAHWLVVRELANLGTGAIEEWNELGSGTFFERSRPFGRIVAAREGNHFRLDVEDVSQLSLLLSPEVIDFSMSVRVAINDAEIFSEVVERDVDTLIEWWMVDEDRRMLYAAQLVFTLFPEGWVLTGF